MNERVSGFSKSSPDRGPDGPTPDYVEPQTGSFARNPKLLAVVGALAAGAFIVATVIIAQSITRGGVGFEFAENTATIAVTDAPACEFIVTGVVTNLENQALRITSTSIDLRQTIDGQVQRQVFASNGSSVDVRVGQELVQIVRFDVPHCPENVADFLPREFTISFTREDGTTGTSEFDTLDFAS